MPATTRAGRAPGAEPALPTAPPPLAPAPPPLVPAPPPRARGFTADPATAAGRVGARRRVEIVGAAAPLPQRRAAGTALAGCTIALFGVAAWASSFAALPERSAARVAVAVVAVCVVLCVRAQPRGVWACSSVYLITLSVFHFGVAALFATDTSFGRIRAQYDFRWLAVFPMSRLFAVATLGVVSATVGVAAMTGWRALRPNPVAAVDHPVSDELSQRPDLRAPAGFVLLAVSVVGLVATVLATGGLGLLFGSYADVGQSALRAPTVPYVLFGMGLGLVLAVIGGPSRWRRAAVVLFAVFAVVALPLGLRGEVMFPAVSAAAVAARRRVVVRGVVVLVGAVLLLAFIGGLREIRQSGLSGVRLQAITFSPVDGIAELGASIRPIGSVLEWRDGLGERPPPGSTFYGQLDRFVEGRLLGHPQPSQFTDERLFNVLIMNREGPIGGSPIAEAYYNFGGTGVILFLLLTGLAVAWMDHGRSARRTATACLVLLVPLVVEVRNAFAAVPSQVLLGLAVLGLIRMAEVGLTRRRASEAVRDAATRRAIAVRPLRPARAAWTGRRPPDLRWPGPHRVPASRSARLPELAVVAAPTAPEPAVAAPPLARARVADEAHRLPTIGRAGAVITGWLGLAAVASLGQAVLTARMLPLAGRGALVVVLTVSAFGALVGGLGTNVAFRHFFGLPDPPVSLGDYLGLTLAMTPIAVVPVTGASMLVLTLSGGARVDAALVLAAAGLAAATMLANQTLDALNAAGSIRLAAGIVAGTGLVQLGLLVVGPPRPSLEHILVVLAAGWAAQAAVCVAALAWSGMSTRPRRDRVAWRLLIGKGLPALGLNVGATVAFRFDRLLVAAFGGASAAAVYSIASATCEALRLLPGSVGQVVFHRAARGRLSRPALARVTRGVCAVLLVAAGVLMLLAPWLLRTLFGSGYAGAVTPMRLLLAAELLLAPFLIECRVLTGLGRTRAAGGIGLVGLLLSVATYPVLVPWLGPAGGAIASMLAYTLMSVLTRLALRVELAPGTTPAQRPAEEPRPDRPPATLGKESL